MGVNDNLWEVALRSLAPAPSEPSSLYGSLLTAVPVTPTPKQPSATLSTQVTAAEERFDKRLRRLKEVLPIRPGRVVPGDEDLPIGDARRLKLSVLFLDICRFSQIDSHDDEDQDRVLTLLNLFMAEMLQVVRAHKGDFEKNTGDGLMAYFKEGSEADCTQLAVDAAVTMHCYNDQVISQKLKAAGMPEMRFRVGIETGPVTVANVGVRGDHHSLVAIGNTPNIACKLMSLIENGGIVLGNYARSLLSHEWQRETQQLGTLSGYVIRGTQNPYPAWELKYRAPDARWLRGFSGMLLGS